MRSIKRLIALSGLILFSNLQGDILVCSYTNDHEFAYSYGAWKKYITSSLSGVIIGPNATVPGGAGNYFKHPISIQH